MPEISLFCGIRVTMFYSDHNPPHFHAEYGGYKALIDIQNSCVIRGALPGRHNSDLNSVFWDLNAVVLTFAMLFEILSTLVCCALIPEAAV